ncbi:mite allergen Der p 3-like [Contarinia nasturtii]|uniref:mite allergen Der p 3-like n=1 Tax=Contarinia nasturtii TaxID=265458 RepID=UPI0012D37E93|nr:mite allergen Der p 3-like [Contarinia nasturtii]
MKSRTNFIVVVSLAVCALHFISEVNSEARIKSEVIMENAIPYTVSVQSQAGFKEFTPCKDGWYMSFKWLFGDKVYNTRDSDINYSDANGHVHACGGGILTDRYIITAAHCVDETEPRNVSVIVGAIDLKKVRSNQRYCVENIIIHEKYRIGEDTDYDIALIKLTRPLNLDQENQIFKAKPLWLSRDNVIPGDTGILGGYGNIHQRYTENVNDTFEVNFWREDGKLRAINTIVVHASACRLPPAHIYNENNLFFICAEGIDGIGFEGDSGSPMIQNLDNGKLYGIYARYFFLYNVTNGRRHSIKETGMLVTRLSTHYDWIVKNIP